jgi:hypothetical protein
MMELSTPHSRPGGMRSTPRALTVVTLSVAFTFVLAACSGRLGAGGTASASETPVGSGTPQNAAAAARVALAQQDRFRGIGLYDATLIGQAAWYKVSAVGDGWEVQIRIGWGDCPAGCINEHRWVYGVSHDGSVHLVSQAGDTLPDGTGVRGTVTSGPVCPVVTEPPTPACADRPVAGAVLLFRDATGTEVARVTSAADGTFSVELAPGAYRLVPQPFHGLMGTPSPTDVAVKAGQLMTVVNVTYDTGIR